MPLAWAVISFLALPPVGIARMQAAVPQGFFTDVKPVAGVNTASFERSPSISADGLTLYFASDQDGPLSDLYQATRVSTDDPFSNVENLGAIVNSAATELGVSISANNLTLYFASNRSGDYDLYQATRTSTGDVFGNVSKVEGSVNSTADERGPNISADELTLYFASDRESGEGARDLYRATRPSTSDPFGNVENLGSTINTAGRDGSPSISFDGLTLFFASDRPGSESEDILDLWLTARSTMGDSFATPINIDNPSLWPPTNINSTAGDFAPSISPDWPAPGSKLYFSTNRTRDADIYQATWVPEPSAGVLATIAFLSLTGCPWRRRVRKEKNMSLVLR